MTTLTSLDTQFMNSALEQLGNANAPVAGLWPGDTGARQPVHTVYGGAQLFKADSVQKLQAGALRNLEQYAPDAATFAQALGITAADPAQTKWLADRVYERVRKKLSTEAVEDFRIDFEDGFGNRPDPEEDAAASAAASEVARGMRDGILSPFIGIRVKSLGEEVKRRSIRTLDIFLSTLLRESGDRLPDPFIITLPKITAPEHVTVFVKVLQELEKKLRLAEGTLKFEIMVETTQSIIDARGQAALPELVRLGGGRITAAHFGTYDYTASCNITAAHQSMDHPACDFARQMMKVTLAGRGIFLSDGATNVMPVGPHKGADLSPSQLKENAAVVHRAWRLSFDHISASLRNGFYQGWDLHPAQLPVRYGACYAFFLSGQAQARDRLKSFMDKAAQATLLGDVFDDAATGQGLLNYFLRGMACGAVTLDEVLATGLTPDEIKSRSFLKILEMRRRRS